MSEAVTAIRRAVRVTGRAEQVFLGVACAALLWLFLWIWLSWPYTLDDALIHLRYADHLLHKHHITYDGIHDSFGTSSLLYVSLLAALRALWTSPLLPRVVSSISYVVFFITLALTLRHLLRGASRAPAALWVISTALLVVFVEPSAARWMNDGMETGLVFLATLLGVVLLRPLSEQKEKSAGFLFVCFLYGLLTVLLRIELLLLVGSVSLVALLSLLQQKGSFSLDSASRRELLGALLPIVGGLTAAGLVFVLMHALLPDTAVAKAFGSSAWNDTFGMTALTIASSFSFGVGLVSLWLISLALAVEAGAVQLSVLWGNLLFPIVLVLSAVRGQQIQGIRYFGWTLLFPLLCNLSQVAQRPERIPRSAELALRTVTVLLLLALLPAAIWESGTFYRLFRGRGSSLQAFRGEPDLRALRGKLGIAEDVGFVGYFTQGDICDPYGLVNGRAAARLKYQQRFDHCVSMHPVFAFGSSEFLHRVNLEESLADWVVCGRYRFDNVRTHDVHFLAVEPAAAETACPDRAEPLRAALPAIF